MKQKLVVPFVPFICLAGWVCGSAQAEDMRLKPGLWEITMQSTRDGAAQQMPKLTPQQQAQMEKMGIKIPASGAGGVTLQTCLTKEQVERDEPPKPRDDARQKCEQKDMKRSGNTVSWKMVCTGEHPMTGTGSMTMQSAEAYSTTMNMVAQDPKSGPVAMSSNMQGKWLGAECKKK